MGPLQLLMGNMSLVTLLNILPQVPSMREKYTLVVSHATTPVAPRPSLGTKWWQPLPNQVVSLPHLGDKAIGTPEEPPFLRWKDKMPFKKGLEGCWQEAFDKDSDLVWQAREDYFKTNQPHFNWETTHDLSDVFWDMILHVSLLDSQIYEIQEAWTGWHYLQYANNALKTSPKGLWFFCLISSSEFPKVMGLTDIHNPDTLHHFTSVTFCPWCGKEGQNEGTVVNHLQTMHLSWG